MQTGGQQHGILNSEFPLRRAASDPAVYRFNRNSERRISNGVSCREAGFARRPGSINISDVAWGFPSCVERASSLRPRVRHQCFVEFPGSVLPAACVLLCALRPASATLRWANARFETLCAAPSPHRIRATQQELKPCQFAGNNRGQLEDN